MKIQQALREIMRGRTTFLISHRFSTIAQSDRIVVMDEGGIAAVGQHDDLVESCPLYKTLYERQFRGVG
jgi:ABC-type multidrug transport system fused ATPase/permease subunit